MNAKTGREFDHPNPQDDPELYSMGACVESPQCCHCRRGDPPNIVGMNVEYARKFLRGRGFTLRVIKEDGIGGLMTQEIDNRRVNVEVRNNVVATPGYLG